MPRRPGARGSGPGTCSSISTFPRTTSGSEGGIATVEGLGALTVARIEAWLARHTAAGARARVTPVIDLAHQDAVDRHDPPPWMAEQVQLRDRQCVFPYCQTRARDCDLDHIVPVRPTR